MKVGARAWQGNVRSRYSTAHLSRKPWDFWYLMSAKCHLLMSKIPLKRQQKGKLWGFLSSVEPLQSGELGSMWACVVWPLFIVANGEHSLVRKTVRFKPVKLSPGQRWLSDDKGLYFESKSGEKKKHIQDLEKQLSILPSSWERYILLIRDLETHGSPLLARIDYRTALSNIVTFADKKPGM